MGVRLLTASGCFKGCILWLILILFTETTNAQPVKRNLFQPLSETRIKQALPAPGQWHPFPTTPAAWRKHLPDSLVKKYIANGEKALQETIPVILATDFLDFTRTKNRTRYQALNFTRRNQLFSLVMAESMEGKGRFTDKIANLVWAICEESFWGLPAHINGLANVEEPYVDLFAAETGALLAWTKYFVGDQLDKVSPRLNQRIKIETDRRMLIPVRTANWWWMGTGDTTVKLNNWSPWIMSNFITVAMLLEYDEDQRAAVIKKALNTMDQYLDGLPDDGAINEGPVYWYPSVGCVFDALDILYHASGGSINMYNQPFLRSAASYIYKVHVHNKDFVNMGDAEPRIEPDGTFLYRTGKATGDSTLMAFGSNADKHIAPPGHPPIDRMFSRRLFSLMELESCVRYEGKYQPLRDAWLPGIQMMCARSDNGFFVSTHGGHNAESHNHNDVGDVVVYLDSFPLLIDAGRGTYTGRTFSPERYSLWFNTSGFHNLPEVNGVQQKDGERFAAREVQYLTNSMKSETTMEIAGAYPAEAGITTWKRTTTLLKKGEVRIHDQFVLQAASDVAQHLLTVCMVDISQPGQLIFTLPDAKQAVLNYAAKEWYATKEVVPLTSEEDEGIRESWKGQTIVRISLHSKRKITKSSSTLLIRRKD